MLKKLFTENTDLDLDDPLLTSRRRDLIMRKGFLKQIYLEWYSIIAKAIPDGDGKVLELGSGGGFIKEVIPDVITSEILKVPNVDLTFDACRDIPFAPGALKAIILVDVLHHLPDVESFFTLASEKLRTGGRIIMIEPWNTPWSGLIYRKLHHEPFDCHSEDWAFPSTGPLSSANGALPWVIFERDIENFKLKFPAFSLKAINRIMPFCYLLSGGLSYKTPVPAAAYKLLRWLEKATLTEASCAMFANIIIEKSK